MSNPDERDDEPEYSHEQEENDREHARYLRFGDGDEERTVMINTQNAALDAYLPLGKVAYEQHVANFPFSIPRMGARDCYWEELTDDLRRGWCRTVKAILEAKEAS